MNMSKILEADSKKVSDEEKLEQIIQTVSQVRESYGNTDQDIDQPEIATTEGAVEIQHVSVATKIDLVKQEVSRIRMEAIEASKTPGVVANKFIEQKVATSPILVNIGKTTEYDIL